MSESSKRLYVVGEQGHALHEQLVEASTQAQAIRQVVGERFYAHPASAKEVQRIMAEQYAREQQSLANVDVPSPKGGAV